MKENEFFLNFLISSPFPFSLERFQHIQNPRILLLLTVIVVQREVRVGLCQQRERRRGDGGGGSPLLPSSSTMLLLLLLLLLSSAASGEPARGLDDGALEVVRPV